MTDQEDMLAGEQPNEIIGSMVVPESEALPLRLVPIGRRDDDYLVPVALEAGGECWIVEDRTWLEEAFDLGDHHRLANPIPYEPGHVLVQFTANGDPEYLPLTGLRARLEQAHDDALQACEEALREGHLDVAEERAWYATRARRDRVIADRLLIALLRDEIPTDQLGVLTSRIPAGDQAPDVDAIKDRWPAIYARVIALAPPGDTVRARLRSLGRPPRRHKSTPLFARAA